MLKSDKNQLRAILQKSFYGLQIAKDN